MNRLCCVLLALLGLGCAPEVVPVQLAFQNQDHFLRSSFFRVVVFPAERSGTDECATRRDHVEGRIFDDVIFDTGVRSMCDMVNEEVLLPDFPEGEHAFVGFTLNEQKEWFWTIGCKTGQLVDRQDGVRIDMFPTVPYMETFRDGAPPPSCPTVQEMCSGRCEGGE